MRTHSRKAYLHNVDFPFNAHILHCILLSVSVVKKELFSLLYSSLGKDSNAVITINHDNFCVTIGVDGVVGESYFIPFSSGIHYKVIVQVEQKTGHALVIDSAPPVCFILGNKLSTVLRDELVLLDWLFDKRTPPRNIRGGQEQVLLDSSLNAAVLTGYLFAVPVVSSPTGHAEVRVTLPYRQVTRTLLGVTLSLTATARKPVLTLPTTQAEFLTKVLCHHTRAGAITRVLRVVTRMIIVHLIGGVVFLQ